MAKIPFTDIRIPFTKDNTPIKEPVVNVANQQEVNISDTIPFQQNLTRLSQDVGKWNSALLSAENFLSPTRVELYRLYKETVMDNHLSSLLTTRKNAILGSKFIVTDKNGLEDITKTALINKKWFYEFLDLSLDSLFYGYSLIQFGDLDNNEFKSIDLVQRQYVRSEKQLVVPTPYGQTGTSYVDAPYKDWCIGVGNRYDLGLLSKAAPLAIWKKQAFISWAIYNELFGQPTRVLKTNKRDAKSLAEAKAFLSQMGTAGWTILNKDDELTLLDGSTTAGQEVFDKMIDKCNSEMSKLILGQTGTTDEKSHVGAANVHERILHQYNESDERFIKFIIEYQLMPLLNDHGFGLEGYTIGIEEDDELTLVEKSKIDIALLPFYEIPDDYIEKTYGTQISGQKSKDIKNGDNSNIQNRLDEYYDIQ